MTKADYVWVILAITLLYFLWSGHRIDCPPWRLMLAALALGIVRRGRTTRNGNQERRGETSGPWRIRQLGEKTPQRRQDDGRLSLLPILTERKVGPSLRHQANLRALIMGVAVGAALLALATLRRRLWGLQKYVHEVGLQPGHLTRHPALTSGELLHGL